jgi:SAM-dependent methyltransferase
LDLACGTGTFLSKFLSQYELTGYGFDKSRGQIEVARKKFKGSSLRYNFKIGDILKLSYPANLDIVTMNYDSLNHLLSLREWRSVFGKIYDSLKSGGIFCFDINTSKRLLNDWEYPEIILKRKLSYVQCAYRPKIQNELIWRKIIIRIFDENYKTIKSYSQIVTQFAIPKTMILRLLKDTGFIQIVENPYIKNVNKNHIFLENRNFFIAQK